MRFRTRRRIDRAVFKRTATSVAKANIPGYFVPRGGYRL